MDPDRWGPASYLSHTFTPIGSNLPPGIVFMWAPEDWTRLFVLVILLLVAAFASGSETALTSVEKLQIRRLREQNAAGSRHVDALMKDPNQFLTAILILNMVAIIVASGIATITALDVFGQGTPTILVSLIFSVFVLIVSEIVPKTLAIRTAERTALRVAPIVVLLARILSPFVVLFRGVTNGAMRLFGVKATPGPFVSDEQLVLLATMGEEQGVLHEEERRRIEAVVEFDDIAAHEVMVPRVDITAVSVESVLSAAIDRALEAGHSRLPVYEETIDSIIGVLYVWDMLRYARANRYDVPVRQIMRPAVKVPESKSIGDIFRDLQLRRVHMAILLDEYGGTAGLLTIEDLLEEIVGEITDEHDPGEPQYIEKIADNEYVFDGRTSLDEVNDAFDTDLDSEEYDSVGGLVFHNLGRLPLVSDTIRVNRLTLAVESMEGPRISKIRITGEDKDESEQ